MVNEQRQSEFERLFAEFAATYPQTPEGRSHAASYSSVREQARRNLEAVLEKRDRREDVTDAVLLGLLPHSNSSGNRAIGAWIHWAPCISGNLRTWFEHAGFTASSDWPFVASAILRFLLRCQEEPSELETACHDFASLPHSKGFQTGMMTPILNAIAPEHFCLINNKSRRCVNYFAGTRHQQPLAGYMQTNATARALVAELAPILSAHPIADLSPADTFDMFCHWFVAVKSQDPEETQYWKLSPGSQGVHWEECRDETFICMGWGGFGDLSELDRETFERRRKEFSERGENWALQGTRALARFAFDIKQGDRVIMNRGTTEILGIGTVVGDYYYVPGVDWGHRRAVKWDDLTHRRVSEGGWRRTLVSLSKEKFDRLCSAPPIDQPTPPPKPAPPPSYPLAACADNTGFDEAELRDWLRALERKKQAILYGPPGTGKTYLAQELAKHLVGGTDGVSDLVQFHPAYAYEDFIQGIRPQSNGDGTLAYPVLPGRFLQFCERARSTSGPCVLIIDEINRANLARVFGELMFLLEYREEEVRLAVDGTPFSIPENVRILGTMNTADRSIALVDHALRRRFAFIELEPKYEVLRRWHARHETGFSPAGLIDALHKVNDAIQDRNYAVGISFFMLEQPTKDLPTVWRTEIEPYLGEYFFDRPEVVESFRWEQVGSRVLGEREPDA